MILQYVYFVASWFATDRPTAIWENLYKRMNAKRFLAILTMCIAFSTPSAAETNAQWCESVGYPVGSEPYKLCVVNTGDPNHLAYRQSQNDYTPQPSNASAFRNNQRARPAISVAPVTAPVLPPISVTEQTCLGFGFSKNTPSFSDCALRLELAKQEAEQSERQYELQKQQYARQLAAQEAKERAIKQERDQQRWLALARFGAGMANSQSSSFAGAMADGNAAMLGIPNTPLPTPPAKPAPQRFTIYTPRGAVVTCVQTGVSLFCN